MSIPKLKRKELFVTKVSLEMEVGNRALLNFEGYDVESLGTSYLPVDPEFLELIAWITLHPGQIPIKIHVEWDDDKWQEIRKQSLC